MRIGLGRVASRHGKPVGRRGEDDRELYQIILGLTIPWTVEWVKLREAKQAVHVLIRATARIVVASPTLGLLRSRTISWNGGGCIAWSPEATSTEWRAGSGLGPRSTPYTMPSITS